MDAALFDLSAQARSVARLSGRGIPFRHARRRVGELSGIRDALAALIEDGRAGRVIREGRTVVIAGLPNAGKSSLFNTLAGAPRAIVTDIPGTTRDLLTERVDVGRAGADAGRHGRAARSTRRNRGRRRAAGAAGAAGGRAHAGGRRRQRAACSTTTRADGAAAPRALVVQTRSGSRRARGACDELGLRHDEVVAVSAISGAGTRRAPRTHRGGAARRARTARSAGHHEHPASRAGRGCARRGRRGPRRRSPTGVTEELVLTDLGARARRASRKSPGGARADDLLLHIFTRFCIGK